MKRSQGFSLDFSYPTFFLPSPHCPWVYEDVRQQIRSNCSWFSEQQHYFWVRVFDHGIWSRSEQELERMTSSLSRSVSGWPDYARHNQSPTATTSLREGTVFSLLCFFTSTNIPFWHGMVMTLVLSFYCITLIACTKHPLGSTLPFAFHSPSI